MNHNIKIIASAILLCQAVGLFAQDTVPVNYKKYPDYNPNRPTVFYTPASSGRSKVKAVEARPRRVDNSEKIYFPPVFNQDQGSCGSASRIGYMFTEEINAYRGTDATVAENMYPTQFTWLLTDHGPGKEGMARDNGIPTVPTYGGRTYSKLFGNQTNDDPFGWMTGYDKWLSAMYNRISGTTNIGALNIPANAEILKGWLWNHNDDPDFEGRGGIAGIGVASACTLGSISTGKYAGQKFVKYWGTSVDHALTIIGYDDDLWCDINGDAIETANEVGAWIIVNSWGNGWANKGFVYCPYSQSVPTQTSTDYWQPELYLVRKNYRPLKTIKIKMDFSHRSELSLSVGVSANLNATAPSKQIALSHFTYCGWEKVNGVKLDDVPMLGQWADGIRHTEPMEFGYDITDLVSTFDPSKPLKYFFTISSSTAATGTGNIQSCSIYDYSLDQNGVEFPFADKNVSILNAGKKTMISTTVQGEQALAIPGNLVWKSATELNWTKPQATTNEVAGYKVYKNDRIVSTLIGADLTSYTATNGQTGDAYSVSAIYSINNNELESAKSNSITQLTPASAPAIVETGSMAFSNCGFTIPGIFTSAIPQCTLEFWIKPTLITNWNFQIGQGWGTFHFQLNASGTISTGYAAVSGEFLTTTEKVLLNEWAHIAIVLDGTKITLYKNGVVIGSVITTSGKGMPILSTFSVGKNATNKGITGNIDEFRVWKTALTQNEILSRKDQIIKHPETLQNLVAYYQMDLASDKLKDSKGTNDATMLCAGTASATDYPLKQTTNNFSMNASCSIGETVSITSTVNPYNTDSVLWTIPDAGLKNYSIDKPSFAFSKAGDLEVTKTIVTTTGEKLSVTKTINVVGVALPDPDFTVTKATVLTGERVSFINTTNSPYTAYKWVMTGANIEETSTTNAATSYNTAGEYTITLTATNASGQKSVSKKIMVETSAPKADFDASQTYTIKGGSLKFDDKSLYSPTSYKWEFDGGTPAVSTEQNPTIAYNHAGKFKVKLTVANDKGQDVIERTKYVIVSNENPGNGLSMDGDNDYLTISNLFSAGASTTAMTFEWWMKPKNNKDNCLVIGNNIFSIKENAKGGLSIGFGDNDRMIVPEGTFEKGSWDHFAFTYNAGNATFYKNGTVLATQVLSTKSVAQATWANGLKLGDASNSVDGTIDELRVWKVARTQEELLLSMDNKLQNPTSITNLEAYLTFDESASTTPLDYSANNRPTLRQNIGPVGDMWSATMAFCVPFYAPVAFTPNATSTYIVYSADSGKRFNTNANSGYAQYKSDFTNDGVVVGPCSTATTHSLNSKYVITGSSEFSILKNGSSWTLKELNSSYWVRRDLGYMVSNSTDSRALITAFHKDEVGKVRISYGSALCLKTTDTDWDNGGSLANFSFIFEEVKPITTAATFADVSGEALQQLRFSTSGQLTGTPKQLQGKVSYAFTIVANKWYPLSFAAPIEEVTFQGRAVSNDTVRMGGKMIAGKDYEIRKYENGNLVAVNLGAGAALPAGSYLIRLKNTTLANKKVVFTTARNVLFKDAPTQALSNGLCGSDMASNVDIQNITGYYKVNGTGDKMLLTKASTVNVVPFEAVVTYTGNVENAPAEINLNGDISAGIDSQVISTDPISVYVENGFVRVKGTEKSFTVYTISGIQVIPNKQLMSGCYIVKVGGKAYKVIAQ